MSKLTIKTNRGQSLRFNPIKPIVLIFTDGSLMMVSKDAGRKIVEARKAGNPETQIIVGPVAFTVKTIYKVLPAPEFVQQYGAWVEDEFEEEVEYEQLTEQIQNYEQHKLAAPSTPQLGS